MDIQQVERMRHLWKDARSKYTSFFACLAEVKNEIGDAALEEWCRSKLFIGLTAITKAAGLLQGIDAERTKSELSRASRTSKDQRELETHARKLAKIKRENELAAERAKNVERMAEAAAEAKKAEKEEKAAKNKQNRINADARTIEVILADPDAPDRVLWERANVSRTFYDKVRNRLVGEGRISPKAKAAALSPETSALFEQYVEEGHAAINHQWILGDLAIKVSALKIYGEGTLERYASQVGVEYATLRDYQSVAKQWPEIVVRPTFSIAKVLVTHPDRAALIAADPHMTVDAAREIMRVRKATTNVVPIKKSAEGAN